MGIRMEQLIQVRPFLYHLTAWQNLNRIWKAGRLYSAASLLNAAGSSPLLERRERSLVVGSHESRTHIRDQEPLHAGNIDFEDGWSMEDLISDLNSRVFFWPGTAQGPIDYGVRHFERYREQDPVVLRVRTAELLQVNRGTTPEVCRFNSGSPRCSGGKKSPRGPRTFLPLAAASFTAGRVVEVTFRHVATLPDSTQYGHSLAGPWQPLGAIG